MPRRKPPEEESAAGCILVLALLIGIVMLLASPAWGIFIIAVGSFVAYMIGCAEKEKKIGI